MFWSLPFLGDASLYLMDNFSVFILALLPLLTSPSKKMVAISIIKS